jgi:hypothetical protein
MHWRLEMTGRDVIEKKIADKLKNDPEQAESIGEKVAVVLTGHDGGRWVLDCTRCDGVHVR